MIKDVEPLLKECEVARKNGKTLIQLPIHAALLKAIEKLKGSD